VGAAFATSEQRLLQQREQLIIIEGIARQRNQIVGINALEFWSRPQIVLFLSFGLQY
jgi:hypothetical protein